MNNCGGSTNISSLVRSILRRSSGGAPSNVGLFQTDGIEIPGTNTPRPVVTPTDTPTPSVTCDPAQLPPIEDVLSTFSGSSNLDPSQYVWWDGSVSDVKVTYYGTRALRTPDITDPNQLPYTEKWDICCGQGAVYINGISHSCKMQDVDRRRMCDLNTNRQEENTYNSLIGWISDSSKCGEFPYLTNETCAVPGETAGIKRGGFLPSQLQGRAFAYIVPSSGNYDEGVAVYINDAGFGSKLIDTSIDIYGGILDEDNNILSSNGKGLLSIYNTEGNTACIVTHRDNIYLMDATPTPTPTP